MKTPGPKYSAIFVAITVLGLGLSQLSPGSMDAPRANELQDKLMSDGPTIIHSTMNSTMDKGDDMSKTYSKPGDEVLRETLTPCNTKSHSRVEPSGHLKTSITTTRQKGFMWTSFPESHCFLLRTNTIPVLAGQAFRALLMKTMW